MSYDYYIPELKLPLSHSPLPAAGPAGAGSMEDSRILERIAHEFGTAAGNIESYHIERKSIDARDKNDIRIVYALRVTLRNAAAPRARRGGRGHDTAHSGAAVFEPASLHETAYVFPSDRKRPLATRPVIVGAGPAGLFAALILAENGYRPLVLERGAPVDERIKKVKTFWENGSLDPDSNIQFGEGGAGTFSDGKLNSTGHDSLGRNEKVIAEFIEAGAPSDIAYSNKPHIGTDYLVSVVKNMRRKIEALGGEVRFNSRVNSLIINPSYAGGDSPGQIAGLMINGQKFMLDDSGPVLHAGTAVLRTALILAPGHGARDLFESLSRDGVPMERKAFAIGVRVEHPQELIARNQYGGSWRNPDLPAADYKLTWRASDGRGVYSFCMCPGGAVVNASSEPGLVACNGMSDYARDGRNANSAIVVQVGPSDFGPGTEPLAGVEFQRRWERLAFTAGGSDFSLPVETLADFSAGRSAASLGAIVPDIRGLWRPGDITAALPDYAVHDIVEAMSAFDRRIHGFSRPDTILVGVETRTSSPVRILRGENGESLIRGLFPCGEGAGYSGGIMSSAVDGIKIAEAVATGAPSQPNAGPHGGAAPLHSADSTPNGNAA